MNFKSLQKIEWTPMMVLKMSGLLLVAVIVLSIAANFIGPSVRVLLNTEGYIGGMPGSMPMYDGAYAVKNSGYSEQMAYGVGGGAKLSLDNVGISYPYPQPGGSIGSDAEEFEVTEYSASIETRDRDVACAEVSKLKKFEYVIFESANEHDTGCSYTFKVLHNRVEEILAAIEALNPKNLSESTYTIKRQLDDFTSETDILKKKLTSIDKTLSGAIDSYDDITALAIRTQNAEALAKIIDSKIGIIERLTQERINIAAHLERLGRSKAEQLDRLEYTYFHVNVYENKFIDGKSIRDSWKESVKTVVLDVNRVIQDVTINLIALLFVIAQYVLYFFVLLVLAKYLWRATLYIWKR